MTDINNKKDFKEINVVDNNLSINAVNNSILIDDKKTLNLVKQVVAQRGALFQKYKKLIRYIELILFHVILLLKW